MSKNQKGWKSHKYPGYVKSHNAVRNGPSRSPSKAEPTILSEEQLGALGWKPAPQTWEEKNLTKDERESRLVAYLKDLEATTGGTVYLPPIVNADGTIENIQQFKVEKDGPEQGHWATVNGKRVWIDGQHNYNRQQNVRTNEHVNQTNVMNNNTRLEKLGDKKVNELTGKTYVKASKYLEGEARIVRYGRVVSVKKAPGCAVERAFERATKRIQHGNCNFLAVNEKKNLAPDNSLESQVQSGAGNAISPVGCEAHV